MGRAVLLVILVVSCIVLLAVCAGLFISYWPWHDACDDNRSCLPMQECYDLHHEESLLNDVILLSCSKRTDRVCCPLLPSNVEVGPEDPEANKGLLSEDNCGPSITTRISVGQEAYLGQFPWMALVAFKQANAAVEYRCGGTLISERYVLTAAHCMDHGFPVSVRLGELDLSQEIDCEDTCADPPVDIEVEKVVSHKDYNRPFLKNDIALIRLKTKAPRTAYISTVCLPFGINVTGEEENRKYTVAGWGTVDSSSENRSDVLQFSEVPSSPVSECSQVQPVEVRPIADLQLCAGGFLGHDVCKGDSGGPLMDTRVDNMGNAKIYQVGIISFGYMSCGGDIPSVYTRVSAYLTWILRNLEP